MCPLPDLHQVVSIPAIMFCEFSGSEEVIHDVLHPRTNPDADCGAGAKDKMVCHDYFQYPRGQQA